MKQQREKFQVIGACRKMQTLSSEEEIKRMDGIPYYIDFYQDFSEASSENIDNRMHISEIIEEVMNPKIIDMREGIQNYNDFLIERQRSEIFWRDCDKMMKKEEKREKQWIKHRKKVTVKQAEKNFNRVYRGMMEG